jgi:glyoxylase-like metal-dependent hydrolase (beta-lactamase superfamily II)
LACVLLYRLEYNFYAIRNHRFMLPNQKNKYRLESSNPSVLAFFEPNSSTFSYLVRDTNSNCCAIVDSVLDFEYASGVVSYQCADEIVACVEEMGLQVTLLLETHVHADHLSAAPYLQQRLGGKIAISKHIMQVQHEFGTLFNEGDDFSRDGSQFDMLLEHKQSFEIGELRGTAIATPGHTPACMSFLIGDALFVGDTLFMPDSGTARADFPGGDARVLYHSIKSLLRLPDDTRVFICHDYQPDGRALEYTTTVADQRQHNIHVNPLVSEDAFVELREARDRQLSMPKLILPSLQVNMRAGFFPPAEDNQVRYLKVPISGLKATSPIQK